MKLTIKILAFALVLVMCLSLVPMTALADSSKKDDYKVIAIGDSTSNGYCLNDYGKFSGSTWCPMWYHDTGLGFMDNASRYSTGYRMADYLTKTLTDKNVVFESLTFEGMRTDELRALLDTSYKGDYFCNPDHLPHYEDMFAGEGSFGGYKASNDVGAATNVYEFYTQEIKDADLIIMDCCTNNFGTYVSDRLMGGHGGQMKETPLDAIDSIAPGFKKTVENTVDKYFSFLKDIISEGMVKELIETCTYAITDMCINFSVDVDTILKLNPDVKLIAVGPFNIMKGLMAEYNGLSIDFGAVWGSLINLANTYITTLDPNRDKFYFANTMNGVELIIDDVAEGEFTSYYVEDLEGYFGKIDEQVLDIVSKAANVTNINLGAIAEHLSSDLKATAKAAVQKAMTEGWDALDSGEQSLLHVFFRFLINGSGTHPSPDGYAVKFEAVKAAYNSRIPASGKSIQVMTTTVSQAAIGVANSVKSPVINIVNKIAPVPSLITAVNDGFDRLTKTLLKLRF